MNIFLILFFIALFGITIMILRRYLSIDSTETNKNYDLELAFDVPDLKDIKNSLNKKINKYGYILIKSFLKKYLLFAKFLKEVSKIIYRKIKTRFFKNKNMDIKPTETSSFVQKMKEYKKKIQRIKNKIKQEEGLN